MTNKKLLESLANDIRAVAKSGNIPESKLFFDEIELFLEEHQHHGYVQVRLFYDDKGTLSTIGLHCDAAELRHPRICRHHDTRLDGEINYTIIYADKPTIELKTQRERRDYVVGDIV